MGDFLSAAEAVLSEHGEPMTAQEIVDAAKASGVLVTRGRTPAQTMKARLSDDILELKEDSRFMRTERGVFALRVWTSRTTEYVADRFAAALLDEDALVFDLSSLGKYVPEPGFVHAPVSAGSDLLAECRPLLRRTAEETVSVVQLVSAFIVRYEERYLTFRRSKRLPEARLHDEFSINFGGHITPRDIFGDGYDGRIYVPLFNPFDPADGLMFLEREFEEELRVPRRPNFTFRGIIYDDRRDVSRQHLALVYEAELGSDEYAIGERGFLRQDKWETLDQVEARLDDFENWSQLIIADEKERTTP